MNAAEKKLRAAEVQQAWREANPEHLRPFIDRPPAGFRWGLPFDGEPRLVKLPPEPKPRPAIDPAEQRGARRERRRIRQAIDAVRAEFVAVRDSEAPNQVRFEVSQRVIVGLDLALDAIRRDARRRSRTGAQRGRR